MKTVCIQIGNSDDKLSQRKWAEYIARIDEVIAEDEYERHFFGGSLINVSWQNACWVIVMREEDMVYLFAKLSAAGTAFGQDAVAVLTGETRFI